MDRERHKPTEGITKLKTGRLRRFYKEDLETKQKTKQTRDYAGAIGAKLTFDQLFKNIKSQYETKHDVPITCSLRVQRTHRSQC